jgi:6-phosphogluconolactonase
MTTFRARLALTLGAIAASAFAFAADPIVYIGTYTRNSSKGIYAFRLSEADGKLTPLGLAAETPSPSFLAIHPSGKYLYAVNEINQFQGQRAGSVTAFSISPAGDGKLTQLNAVSTKGTGPCHISIDPKGKTALIANYGGGSIASYGIGADGRLTEAVSFIQHTGSSVSPRQREPHAHSINVDAKRKRAAVADLGLDRLLFYSLDPGKHVLSNTPSVAVSLPPGSGPRHYAMHPNRKFGYVINEMLLTVAAVDLRANPPAIFQSISTLPGKIEQGYSTAEVVVHPSGKFLYGSNRGHNTIAAFSIDSKTGRLTAIGHTSTEGKTPRNFAIDPSGKFLLAANQDSGNVVVFRIGSDGKLTSTGHSVEAGIPVCVRFLKVK